MSERITAAEAVYHRRALRQLHDAQAVWASWSSHLVAAYSLQQGDDISEDGTILRAEQPAADQEMRSTVRSWGDPLDTGPQDAR